MKKYSEIKMKNGMIASLYFNDISTLYSYQIDSSCGFEHGGGGFQTVGEMLSEVARHDEGGQQ